MGKNEKRKGIKRFSNSEKGLVPLLQEAIFRSKKHFTSILNSLHDGILFYGNSLSLIAKNKEADQLIQKCKPDNLQDEQAEQEFMEHLRQILEDVADEVLSGRIIEKEITINNGKHFIRLTFYPLDDAGDNLGIAVGLKDITAEKKAEKLLRYEAALLDDIKDAIISTDLEFSIISFNRAAETIYGIKEVEAIGKKITELVEYCYESGSEEEAFQALQAENKWQGEVSLIRKDGKKIFVEAGVSYVLDEAGKRTGVVAVNRDITEKKMLKEKVSSFDDYISTVLNSTREAIFLLDLEGNIKVFNKHTRILIYQFTGFDIKKINNLIDAVPEFRKMEVKENILAASLGKVKDYEVKYPDGKWLHVNFLPVYNKNNHIEELCCTLRNITEKKEAEEKIKRSEEMYRSLVEAMMEGVVFQSDELNSNTANESAAKILGVPKKVLKQYGLQVPGFIWVNQKEQSVEIANLFCPKLMQDKPARNLILGLKKNDTLTWLSINAEPVKKDHNGNIHGCVFTFTDITEALKNRDELNLLSKVVKETSNIVVITDKEEKIVWANDSFTKTSEYTLEEALNRKPGRLLSGPEKNINEVAKIRTAIKKGEPVRGEILNYSKTGKKYWSNYNIHPVKDEEGNLVKFFSIQSDITELKRIQEEIVRQKLDHQSQMAYATLKGQEDKQTQIGQELHDNVNQILAACKLYLGFINRGKGNVKENIAFVNEGLQLAIDEIRKLSHQLVAPRFKEKNLAEVLESLTRTVPSPACVELRANQLNEGNIAPDIKLALYRIAQEQLNNIGKYAKASNVYVTIRSSDQNIVMSVEDDGIGFDTKEKRNGIGINNIYNRAESLYGKAEIISSPGKGCKLNVIIPLKNAI